MVRLSPGRGSVAQRPQVRLSVRGGVCCSARARSARARLSATAAASCARACPGLLLSATAVAVLALLTRSCNKAGVILSAPCRELTGCSSGSRAAWRYTSAMPSMVAASSRERGVAQGPKPSARQMLSSGASTIAPWLTRTTARFASAWVTKSVPLTPMATSGVFRRNLSRAACAASPEMPRTVPVSR
ncbi:MAG: hypothetical protein AW09_001399 [Candidatus Accumulibacter phosphatis]|uniref:Uncharacterized protein n=1 Tax=Candidatus Accumulibacter phosphatis TaxID=327160 RepID=A0A080LZA6_9PROT|nr:MAG: hypothetical protein AW09_001399 [Candidatus Accumulibacter phosphatis]